MSIRYLSVCSGIEAASVAWGHLGWKPVAFSEIEKFPAAVLKHHYPDVPNLGDMTKFEEWDIAPGTIDLLVGGTPCQSFSVAGLRKGLADSRGNLSLVYCRLLAHFQPRWFVWENVPGVLSSNGGRDFGSFLSGVAECGYGWAYRVLDAQYVRTQRFPRAVPQRRRRVFVVGCLGSWTRSAAVLFERNSLRRDLTPSRKAGKEVAGTLKGGSGTRGYPDPSDGNGGGLVASVAGSLACNTGPNGHDAGNFACNQAVDAGHIIVSMRESGQGFWQEDTVAGPIRAEGENRPSRPSNVVAYPINTQMALRGPDTSNTAREGVGIGEEGDPAFTVQANHGHAVAFQQNTRDEVRLINGDGQVVGALASELGMKQQNYVAFNSRQDPHSSSETFGTVDTYSQSQAVAFGGDVARSLTARHDSSPCADRGMDVVANNMTVRRLTPAECENLQGFPRDYTKIPWRGKPAEECPDGPRYKALGNSFATNCMEWIGTRIQMVEEIQ